jgi:hypothetical protein
MPLSEHSEDNKTQNERLVPRRDFLHGLIAAIATEAAGASACNIVEETPMDRLVGKFFQNFNPYVYKPFSEGVYGLSESRCEDKACEIDCSGLGGDVMGASEVIKFLTECKSRQQIINHFAERELDQTWSEEQKPANAAEREEWAAVLQKKRHLKVDDINVEKDLATIFAMMGRDPEMYLAFMRAAVSYQMWDLAPEETFRHPLDSIRSGWVDCDDWAVLHYFWAYMHSLDPSLVIAAQPVEKGIEAGSSTIRVAAHSIVTYPGKAKNGSARLIILDNGQMKEWDPAVSLQEYFDENFSEGLIVEFNGKPLES